MTYDLVNRVKTNNSDDKVFANTSWYIIVNADDQNQNALSKEQTSVYLETYRTTHIAIKTKPVTIFIKIDFRSGSNRHS
jgi:hypothetical protein